MHVFAFADLPAAQFQRSNHCAMADVIRIVDVQDAIEAHLATEAHLRFRTNKRCDAGPVPGGEPLDEFSVIPHQLVLFLIRRCYRREQYQDEAEATR